MEFQFEMGSLVSSLLRAIMVLTCRFKDKKTVVMPKCTKMYGYGCSPKSGFGDIKGCGSGGSFNAHLIFSIIYILNLTSG